MLEHQTSSRLAGFVELIESGNLDAFAMNLDSDREFLHSEVKATHVNGSTALLMALLARFRDDGKEV